MIQKSIYDSAQLVSVVIEQSLLPYRKQCGLKPAMKHADFNKLMNEIQYNKQAAISMLSENTKWDNFPKTRANRDLKVVPEIYNLHKQITKKDKASRVNEDYVDLQIMSPLVMIYRLNTGDEQTQKLYARLQEKQKIIYQRVSTNPVQSHLQKERPLLKFIIVNNNTYQQKSEDQQLKELFCEVIEKQLEMQVNNAIFTYGNLFNAAYSYYENLIREAAKESKRPRRIVYINFSKQEQQVNVIKWKKVPQAQYLDKDPNNQDLARQFYISFFQDIISPILQQQNNKCEVDYNELKKINIQSTQLISQQPTQSSTNQMELEIGLGNKRINQDLDDQESFLKLIDDKTLLIPIPMFSDQLESYQLERIAEYLHIVIQKYNPHQVFCNIDLKMDPIGQQNLIYKLAQISTNKLIVKVQEKYEDINVLIEGFQDVNQVIPQIILTAEKQKERIIWYNQAIKLLKSYKRFDPIRYWYDDLKQIGVNMTLISQDTLCTNHKYSNHPLEIQDGILFLSNKIIVNGVTYELFSQGALHVFIQQKSLVVIDKNMIYIHDALIDGNDKHCYGEIELASSNIKMTEILDFPNIIIPTIMIKNNLIYWIYGYKVENGNHIFNDQIYEFHLDQTFTIIKRNQNEQFTNDLLTTIDGAYIAGRAYSGVSQIGIFEGDITLFGGTDISGDKIFNMIETIKFCQNEKNEIEFYSAIVKKEKSRSKVQMRPDPYPLVIFFQDSFYIFPGNKSILSNQFKYSSNVTNQGIKFKALADSFLMETFQIIYKDQESHITIDKGSNGWINQSILNENSITCCFQKLILYQDIYKYKMEPNNKLIKDQVEQIQYQVNLKERQMNENSLMTLQFQYDISIQNVTQIQQDGSTKELPTQQAILDLKVNIVSLPLFLTSNSIETQPDPKNERQSQIKCSR